MVTFPITCLLLWIKPLKSATQGSLSEFSACLILHPYDPGRGVRPVSDVPCVEPPSPNRRPPRIRMRKAVGNRCRKPGRWSRGESDSPAPQTPYGKTFPTAHGRTASDLLGRTTHATASTNLVIACITAGTPGYPTGIDTDQGVQDRNIASSKRCYTCGKRRCVLASKP